MTFDVHLAAETGSVFDDTLVLHVAGAASGFDLLRFKEVRR